MFDAALLLQSLTFLSIVAKHIDRTAQFSDFVLTIGIWQIDFEILLRDFHHTLIEFLQRE
ncbi:hypothetical protein [uncultured Cohaesibacter sp.]|uniref:hypothetical protein n=1 Tax=uncultured Cohaesibacter sp. TaxID=1002546 RepID=UPI00292D955B|nr:hypothetical protein [uncultured Cohaesibacter sp.]